MALENINIRKYIVYVFSLFLISLGACISIKANLGTSPIICVPYVSSLILGFSIGTTCFIFNFIYVLVELILLRGDFEKIQYLQIIVGIIFSASMDFSMMLVSFVNPTNYLSQIGWLLVSCFVVACGVLLEVKTEVVYLPPDGIIVAISKVFKKEFPKVKPVFDTSMVIIAAVLSIVFLGYLAGVREGTVIYALIIGPIVKILQKYLNNPVDKMIS